MARRTLHLLMLAVCCLHGAQAQAPALPQPPLSRPAREWAQQAAQNELQDLKENGFYLRYRSRLVNAHGDQTRDLIQSREGTVARLILRDGKALTPEQDAAELSRLNAMLQSPESFTRHVRNDDSSRKNGADIIRQLPQAMLWTYAEGQPQRPGLGHGTDASHSADAAEIVLDFTPDPAWSPPTLLAGALTGLHGRLWIDPRSRHVSRLEAQVFKPVNVGFGLVGKVFPGGTLTLDEVYAGNVRWVYSSFSEHLTVRALMLKTLKENTDLHAFDFTRVEAMSYQEAIHLLLATPLP